MGGLPQNPKVQGYIQQEAFDKFQDYCKLHKLSQSAGLDVVIAGFFGIKREVTEREQHEQTTTSIETSNILVAEISKLNERVGILERWKLDIESLSDISEDISTANLTCPIAEPAANLGEPVANTLANLNREAADILVNPIQSGADTSMGIADTIANPDVNPGTGIAASALGKPPTKENLTRKELGKLLGVSHESIRIWEQSGRLKKMGWEPVPGTGGSIHNPIRYCQTSR